MAAYYVVCWLVIIACHIACLRSVATAAPALDEHFFDNVRLDVDAGRGVFEGTYTLSSSNGESGGLSGAWSQVKNVAVRTLGAGLSGRLLASNEVEIVVLNANGFQLRMREPSALDQTIDNIAAASPPDTRVIVNGAYFENKCGNIVSNGEIVDAATRLPGSPLLPSDPRSFVDLVAWSQFNNYYFGYTEADFPAFQIGTPDPILPHFKAGLGGLRGLIKSRVLQPAHGDLATWRANNLPGSWLVIGLHYATDQVILVLAFLPIQRLIDLLVMIGIDDAVMADGASSLGLWVDGRTLIRHGRQTPKILQGTRAACNQSPDINEEYTVPSYLLFIAR